MSNAVNLPRSPAGTLLSAGDDSGNPECISFVAPATGWYYLIVDAYSGCGQVTVTIDSPVANEDESWGAVKAIYR